MNPLYILALISDLYAQVAVLTEQNASLREAMNTSDTEKEVV